MAAVAEVRYGIVGVGMMGREHLHNLAHLAGEVEREQSVRVRLACLADPHPESLLLGLRLAAELGLPAPQGEAFVPESTVRVGKRARGRDGVVTIKAEDDRVKYQGLHHGSSYLEHLSFLSAIRAQGACSPTINLNDGLLSVAIGVAGQLSIEKGRFVTIEEVLSI